jgi:hypothetical protein
VQYRGENKFLCSASNKKKSATFLNILKGQCHEIFYPRFFSSIDHP